MFRALFFLAGLFLVLQAGLALAISEVRLHDWAARRLDVLPLQSGGVLPLPAWLSPVLVSTGLVTLMYAVALPKRRDD